MTDAASLLYSWDCRQRKVKVGNLSEIHESREYTNGWT
jgi:hypothetical protein